MSRLARSELGSRRGCLSPLLLLVAGDEPGVVVPLFHFQSVLQFALLLILSQTQGYEYRPKNVRKEASGMDTATFLEPILTMTSRTDIDH